MTTRPYVYIAVPMRRDPYGCVRRSIEAAERIIEVGGVPFIPALHVLWDIVSVQARCRTVDYYLDNVDLPYIDLSSCLWRLEGQSEGADIEARYALEHGIPVFREEEWAELRDFIRAWPPQ